MMRVRVKGEVKGNRTLASPSPPAAAPRDAHKGEGMPIMEEGLGGGGVAGNGAVAKKRKHINAATTSAGGGERNKRPTAATPLGKPEPWGKGKGRAPGQAPVNMQSQGGGAEAAALAHRAQRSPSLPVSAAGSPSGRQKKPWRRCFVCEKPQPGLPQCPICENFLHLGCMTPPRTRLPKDGPALCGYCCGGGHDEVLVVPAGWSKSFLSPPTKQELAGFWESVRGKPAVAGPATAAAVAASFPHPQASP